MEELGSGSVVDMPNGCLACNKEAIVGCLRAKGFDPDRIVEVPRPRHAWKDVLICQECGSAHMIRPAKEESMPETKEKAKRTGQHYTDYEVALICLYRKSPEAATRLARLCERTATAIDWVWAWRDREEKFQDRSRNSIIRQIQKAKEELGDQFDSLEA